ncbi:MAG: RNA 2',3'-cyclic phosphodiesterase [Nitrospirota bacterium]
MRCFIAIELPDSVKSCLTRLQDELKKCKADIRWVNPGNVHLTLKFLGNIKEEMLQTISNGMKKVCSSSNPFNLEIKGIGMFPNAKSPRVLWLGVENNSFIMSLQTGIEKEMEKAGFKQEERKFKAHLTIGRFRSSSGKEDIFKAVSTHEKDSLGIINVNSMSLMKSELNPDGARHTRIAEIPLGKNGTDI